MSRVQQVLRGGDTVEGQSPSSDVIIEVQDVSKIYATGAGDFAAIDGVSLIVRRGEFLGIIGKSGAGKTTLLNLISGVSGISAGDVLFHSGNGSKPAKVTSLQGLNENKLAVWRGNNLGIIYQSFELMPQINLLKNVMLPQDFLGTYKRRISEEWALQLLDQVELAEHAYKLPAHTSGGQKQRIAIARALVNDPPVIIADEPTGNLDTVTADTIFQIFESLVEQGKTVIVVTHDNSLVSRFSRHIYIVDGKIVSSYGTSTFTEEEMPNGSAQAIEAVAADNGKGKHSTAPAASSGEDQSSAGQAAISLRNLTKTYVNAAGEFPALKGIDLEIGYGQFVSLVGKSGCGKSTLLNMITGIDHPTAGEVIVGGKDVYEMSESERALWRGRNVGIVFQFFQLLPTLTLLENTMLPMDYCNVHKAGERAERAMELLALVGLEEQAHQLPSSMSSGQQQRAAIARALATDPPIIVADEPTGNLDSRSAETILRLFKQMAQQGRTILLVTHDPSFTKVTDQTVILSDGEMIDDLISRSLPLLSHPLMLQATHSAEKRTYQPSEPIIRQGERVDHFFLIGNGTVDIWLNNPGCPEVRLAQLSEGQFFGEVELLHSAGSIASARASSEGPLELSLLPKSVFQDLIKRSPSTERMVSEIAQDRLRENRSQNGSCEE